MMKSLMGANGAFIAVLAVFLAGVLSWGHAGGGPAMVTLFAAAILLLGRIKAVAMRVEPAVLTVRSRRQGRR